MTVTDLNSLPKKAGIYYFRNTKNGKYYIGQALEIYDRVRKHFMNFEAGRYPDAHLYRGFKKHGIDAFEMGVIEIVDLPKGDERNKKLDELEVKYIKEYNSYGTGGYNQTKGGDGGIDGYKFTEQQKKRVRINGLLMALDGRYKLFFYDTYSKQYGEVPSFVVFLEAIDRLDERNRFKEKQICYFGRYIISRSENMLNEKIKKFLSPDYHYTILESIDYETKNLLEVINNKVISIQKEIEEFYAIYGRAKYNRKDNKEKKETLRKELKADLEAGITKTDYKEKYNVKTDATFYEHVKKLCPAWTSREDYVQNDYMTDEMKEDILTGMNCCRFIKKYKLSESTYFRYKYKLEKEYNIEIKCNYYKKPGAELSDEQESDILNGMRPVDYMIKYDVAEDTFYSHRKRVKEKYPDIKIETKYSKENRKLDMDSIQKDIENGMVAREFCKKYVVGESCYRRYKRKFSKSGNRPIPSCITEEMQTDLKNGIKCREYCEKYNFSKDTYYNHKYALNISKEEKIPGDFLSEEQRNDLLSGMDLFEYMEKYRVRSETYYKHRRYVIPDDFERCKYNCDYTRNSNRGFSEEQKQDLLNGMKERDYMIKYRVSRKTYKRHKNKAFTKQE